MRVLIVGSMHVGNIGDDLLGAILCETIRDIVPDAEILVENTSNIDLADQADVVIVGPGGLIDDVVVENIDNYMRFLRKAQQRGIVNMMIGVGVQRLKSSVSKRECREVLNKADLVTVRSRGDAQALREAGVTVPVYALQDPAFMLCNKHILNSLLHQADNRSYVQAIREAVPRVSTKPTLGFCLMNWDFNHVDRNKIQPNMVQIASKYTHYIYENMGTLTKYFKVILICQSEHDYPFYKKLGEMYALHVIKLHETSLKNSVELYEVYRDVDYVMAGRFHGLIMAMITRKPLMNISIANHKQLKLMEDQPSLAKANYSLEQLYEEDLFTKFVEEYKARKLPRANQEETARCAELAEMNATLIEYQLLRAV